MTNVAQVFNAGADSYDAARRRLIPPFDSFYEVATEAVALAGSLQRVLDIGAGTGLLSSCVRDAFPDAHLTLLDAAPAMLAQARESLGTDNASYVEGKLEEPLPQGPWDAVVSALAIHHLSDARKRDLFARVLAGLRPGGVFVNAEQVAAPTPRLSELYSSWHERRAREAGSDDAEWQGALERMSHDRLAGVEDQLTWLRQAGFAEVDCLFKEYRFAVVVAVRG
jgi:tRNA (cmo5U34)-methyltransferase